MKKELFRSAIILFLLAGCGPKIHTLYDHQVDFSKYKSFCWMKGCEFKYTGPKYLSDSVVRRYFKNAITDVMKSKGIVYNSDYPDLLVDLHITVEKKKDVLYNREQEAQKFFFPFSDAVVIEFLKGTLVIDVADKNQGRMIWRSAAVGYMDIHPELTEKNIRNGIERVLKDFPPPVAGKTDSNETK